MKRASILLGIVLSLAARDADAQWNVARYEAERNHVFATVGLNPAVVTSVGYGRIVSAFGHPIQVAGEVGVAGTQLDAGDSRARLGVQTSLLRWRSVHLIGNATAVARGTDNVIYRGINFGADITGTLGVYRPRWFAAAEFGKDKAVVTHVTHTDYYRNTFHPDAKDGWYLDAGGTFHYGVSAGFTLGKAQLVARAGRLRTEDFNDLMPPAYVSVGLGWAF